MRFAQESFSCHALASRSNEEAVIFEPSGDVNNKSKENGNSTHLLLCCDSDFRVDTCAWAKKSSSNPLCPDQGARLFFP
ncbi:MAG: hypothetical protein KKB53_07970, partial [Acidobacteria bacterium]|nr:hypothetical protein [Acidobacteriota bacterium]